jgi:S-adenosylmethionine hydrolase
MPARSSSPIITLTSDFGTSDSYVAQMKGVLLRYCPTARLVDVTHEIPAYDLVAGSLALERALASFPPGTLHLAVVDPGVGGKRKLLVATIAKQTVVCPDNGLITWAWHTLGPGKAFELTWRPAKFSATFHGRDIMAPAVGMLATGRKLRDLASPLADPVLLDLVPSDSGLGRVLHIDHFGNATTNIPGELADGKAVRIKGKSLGTLRATYSDVLVGSPLALIGSSGLLEIALREGSAAAKLKLKVGDKVRLVPSPGTPGEG